MLKGKRLFEKVKPYAKKAKASGNVYRLAILYILSQKSMEVGEIQKALGIKDNLLSHHLKELYNNGWVLKVKHGRYVTYRLNEKAFVEFNQLFKGTVFYRDVLSRYLK